MKICYLWETYIREIKPSDIGVVSGQNGRVKMKLSYGSFFLFLANGPRLWGMREGTIRKVGRKERLQV
jgi:hypothetical protein